MRHIQSNKQELANLLRRAADALEEKVYAERSVSAAQQKIFDFDWRSSWQDAMDTQEDG